MAKKSYHVVRNSQNGWSVKKSKSVRASKKFATQKEAIKWARKVSKKQGCELVIHRKDGTIKQKDSHGKDSNPPKDRDTH